MNPVKIKTSKASILVVPVPEGSREHQMMDVDHENKLTKLYYEDSTGGGIILLEYNPKLNFEDYTIIGLLSQLTEEQAAGIIPNPSGIDDTGAFCKVSYREGFLATMHMSGAYTENPYGKDHPAKVRGEVFEFEQDEVNEEVKSWQTAQLTTSKEWLVININE